jgi:hypothetical protein
VQAQQQSERVTYRIILLHRDGTKLLLLGDGQDFSLPYVRIPRWRRIAESLTTAVQKGWAQETISLFELGLPARPAEIHHQVMLSSGPNGLPPAEIQWVPIASLTESAFRERTDYEAIRQAVAEIQAYSSGSKPSPFGNATWFAELTEWIEGAIQPLGIRLTGKFQQLNASPTFSLIRFETDGRAIWFKAVGEPNAHEFPASLELARLFPRFVPKVVSTRPDWNAWLTIEAEGTHLDQNSDLHAWTTAATALADLQIESFGKTLHLLNAGCKDIRVHSLLRLVEPFLQVMTDLMEQQSKLSPPPLSRQELASLGNRLARCLADFEEIGLPNSLGHLDFNPGNILISGSSCVFLDWAEGYVGPPFLTFQYLLEHLRRLRPEQRSWDATLTSCYVKKWERFVSPRCAAEALAISPLIAAFAYAVADDAWHQEDGHSLAARYLRSLTRRMKHEGDLLSVREVKCIP